MGSIPGRATKIPHACEAASRVEAQWMRAGLGEKVTAGPSRPPVRPPACSAVYSLTAVAPTPARLAGSHVHESMSLDTPRARQNPPTTSEQGDHRPGGAPLGCVCACACASVSSHCTFWVPLGPKGGSHGPCCFVTRSL